MQKAVGLLVLCWLSAAGLRAGLIPISYSANATATTFQYTGIAGLLNGAIFPTGSQTYNGVPFNLGPIWSADVAAAGGSGTITDTIIIDVNNVNTVYTLLNTEWGQPGTPSLVTYTFTFSNNSTYVVSLLGNAQVRDYNNYTWTDSISATWSAPSGMTDSTVNAWNDASLGLGCPEQACSEQNYQRLDEQIINIPNSFNGLTLVSLTITDTGTHATFPPGLTDQRSFLSALTVGGTNVTSVPEPGTFALLFGGLGIVALRKRLVKS
jgi:hypothetical protein